jgi:hypothetical protein
MPRCSQTRKARQYPPLNAPGRNALLLPPSRPRSAGKSTQQEVMSILLLRLRAAADTPALSLWERLARGCLGKVSVEVALLAPSTALGDRDLHRRPARETSEVRLCLPDPVRLRARFGCVFTAVPAVAIKRLFKLTKKRGPDVVMVGPREAWIWMVGCCRRDRSPKPYSESSS